MATRQKLIHLHSAAALDYAKASAATMALGEIAVKHATGTGDTANVNSELYILNGNTGATGDNRIVSFPSKAYVDAKIKNSNGSIAGLQGEVDKIEAAVGLTGEGDKSAWAAGTTYIKDTTTFKAAIEALDTQAKKNAAAAAAAKSVVSGSTNIAVEPATGSNGAVTYTVKANDLVTTTDYTTFKGHITKQAGVTGESDTVSFTDTNYLTGVTSLKAAIEKLATQAKTNADAAASAATTAAKHTKVVGANNISVSSADTNGQVTYTVDGSKLATVTGLTAVSDRVTVIEKFFNEAATGGTDVIDTLKEIQEYIATDKTGAAAMATKLKNITEVLDGYLKTETSGSNTAIKGIIDNKAEKTALAAVETTVNHIAAQAGVDGTSDTVSFGSTNYISNGSTLKAAIEALDAQANLNATAAAKHTTIVAGTNIVVTEDTNGNQGKQYTISTTGVATSTELTGVANRVKTIEDNYVDTITIKNSTARGVTATKSARSYEINLDAMIIDCGEY